MNPFFAWPFSKILIFLSVFVFTCNEPGAQPRRLVYRNIGNPEDYSSDFTWCLFQDSRGLIWIGTARGLDRWDGSRLQSYPYKPFYPHALPAPNITSITEDSSDNLWLGTGDANRLIKFNLKTERFTLIRVPTDSVMFHYTQVKWDPSGFLWVGTYYGLFRYYPEKDSLVHVPVEEPDFEKSSNDIGSITFDTSGGVWVTDFYMHMYYWDRRKDRLIPQHSLDEKLPHLFAHAYKFSMDKDGNLIMLGPRSEILKLNPYQQTIDLVKPADSYISASSDGGIAVDKSGNIWYGRGHGLMHYNAVNGRTTKLETDGVSQVISDILYDRQGNVLVGTHEGLKLVNRMASDLDLFSAARELISKEGLWINHIVRSGKNFWLGTYNSGLIRYNQETGLISTYRKGTGQGTLPSDNIYSVMKDKNADIWVVADMNLLYYDPERGDFDMVNSYTCPFITADKQGFFWYCWFDHLMRFDPISRDTIRFSFKRPIKDMHTRTDFFSCAMDVNGNFWLGGTYGLTRIVPSTGEWSRYVFDRNDPQSLPNNQISAICCDSKGRVWAGTSVGLYQIFHENSTGVFTCRNIEYQGRDLGFIYKIEEDNRGNIWIGGQFGLSVIKTDGTLECYSSADGLPDFPSFIRAVNSDDDGTIYAGTYDIVGIHNSFLESGASIPEIMITGFILKGLPVAVGKDCPLEQSILFTDRIDLDVDQNSIRIDFSALDYNDSERNRYTYILEGIDRDTVYSGNRSYAEYNGLPPGYYRFWVTGSNSAGRWNPVGTSLVIRIHPPWYKSAMAITIFGLLLILLIFVFIRVQIYRLRNEKLRLAKEVDIRTEEIRLKNDQITMLDSLKTRFFTNISHEFRTLTTLIKIPAENLLAELEITHKVRSNLELILKNSRKLVLLVNQLLDISKIDAGMMKISLIFGNVFESVRATAISFHSLAESKGIIYEIDIPSGTLEEWFDHDKVEKIITNIISNAFKFTEHGGLVKVTVKADIPKNIQATWLEIIISDTGYGINADDKIKIFDRFYQAHEQQNKYGGTGIGLSLAHELVCLMHGSIKVESRPGKGSSFIVQIPLGKRHLKSNEYTTIRCDDDVKALTHNGIMVEKSQQQSFCEEVKTFPNVRNPIVLVVEDNFDVRKMIANLLQDQFSIREAANGREGLEISLKIIPDLVIADLMMPVMDGVEMCRQIKTDIRTSHVPVLMLTARAAQENRMLGFEAGADDYITKPFESQEVLIRVRNLIEQRRKLREKYSLYFQTDFLDPALTSIDQKFLKKVVTLIETHVNEEFFDVTMLGKEMAMSRSTLLRKLQAITGLTPVEFIRNMRLKKAALLLKNNYGNISEIALEVGLSNPSYFTRIFREMYGQSPKEYARYHRQSQTDISNSA